MTDASLRQRDPEEIRKAARLFKALAHPARLEIACLLSQRPATQKGLVEMLGWPQSSVARFLAPLRELGLIAAERQGSEIRLWIDSPIIRDLAECVCQWRHPARDAARPRPGDDGRRVR